MKNSKQIKSMGFMKLQGAVLALAMTATAVVPLQAHAVLAFASGLDVTNWISGSPYPSDASAFANVMLCAGLLPICLLDQKVDGVSGGVSAATLQESGYSANEISRIMTDQAHVVAALKAKNLALRIGANDTRETISSQVRSVYPNASQLYVNFLSDNAALK